MKNILFVVQNHLMILFVSNKETENFLKFLTNNHYLVLSNINTINNFVFDNDNKIDLGKKFFYDIWLQDNEKQLLVDGNLNFSKDEIIEIWLNINKYEAMHFLFYIFDKWKIEKYNTNILKHVFDKYAKEFSLLQILNIVKYVTDKHASAILSHDLTKSQAGYAITKHLDNYFYWAINKGVEVREMKLGTFKPALVTQYFYNQVLHNMKRGFSMIPQKN